jgi:hypothetical protein
MDVENLDRTRIQSLDCPTFKESLYRLSCPGPSSVYMKYEISLHLSKKNERERKFGIHRHKQECTVTLGLREV